MSGVAEVLAGVAVVALMIASQVKGQALRGKRVLALPAVLLVVGLAGLSNFHPVSPLDVALIGTSVLVAVVIGTAQGRCMHLEERDAGLWGRMPAGGLWLWAALILSRLLVTVVAVALGAKAASSTDAVLLVLGVNRLAQAGVVTLRALAAGVAFAPEKDGRVFGPRVSTRVGEARSLEAHSWRELGGWRGETAQAQG